MDSNSISTLPPPVSPRDVIVAAIAEGATLRLHVREQLDPARPTRPLEARPLALVRGRDGRERVVLAVASGDEPVEQRVVLERVARAEWLLADVPRPARAVSGTVRLGAPAGPTAEYPAVTVRPPAARTAGRGR